MEACYWEVTLFNKPGHYYTNNRGDLFQFLRENHISLTGRVLEVGCAGGAAGLHLRRLGATKLEGIEPFEPAASDARASGHYDTVHNYTWEEWAAGSTPTTQMYDAIIFADVLEHIADPAPVLRLAHNLLKKPSGKLVLSLPNVRHLSVLFGLIIRGDWKYKPSGILDQTHLRFFTTKSARRLLTESGFTVISMQRWGVLRLARATAKFVPVFGEFVLRLIFIVAVPTEPPVEAL